MLADSEFVLMSDMIMVLSWPFLGRFLDGVSGRPLGGSDVLHPPPRLRSDSYVVGRAKPVGLLRPAAFPLNVAYIAMQ
jgi:hypothetical protein